MTVSVLLADDEGLIRSALATLLPLEADIQVVAEADNGVDALARYEELRPDVAVLDLEMPGLSGVDVATKLLGEDQERAVVILTRHARPGTLRSALRVGVRGFVGKDADPKLIASAVIDVAEGGRYIDPNVSAQALIDDCPLTERELDVLRVAVDGYSVSEIAATLHLAEGTVRNYLSNAIQKTGSRTRHEAARTARERDWL